MTCRADTDRQTNKQTEIVKTDGPIDFFWVIFFLHFFIDEWSNICNKKKKKQNKTKQARRTAMDRSNIGNL